MELLGMMDLEGKFSKPPKTCHFCRRKKKKGEKGWLRASGGPSFVTTPMLCCPECQVKEGIVSQGGYSD